MCSIPVLRNFDHRPVAGGGRINPLVLPSGMVSWVLRRRMDKLVMLVHCDKVCVPGFNIYGIGNISIVNGIMIHLQTI